jgi:hypothetical protein
LPSSACPHPNPLPAGEGTTLGATGVSPVPVALSPRVATRGNETQ